MKKIALAAVAVAAMFAAPAFAEDGSIYGNIGYAKTQFDVKADVYKHTADFDSITGRVGYRAKHIGVEGELSGGINKDNWNVLSVGSVSTKLNYQVGGYVVGFWPVANNFEVFGRLGASYSEVKVTGKVSGKTVAGGTKDSTDFAYGVGAQYFFGSDAKNGVRVDYTRVDEANNFGVSYVRKF